MAKFIKTKSKKLNMKDDLIMWLIFGLIVVGVILQNTKIDLQSAGSGIAVIGLGLLLILFGKKH